MDPFLLPATRYEPPPIWQAQRRVLNAIIEDDYSENDDSSYIDEELDDEGSGRTRSSVTSLSVGSSTSPVPSLTSSISSYYQQSRGSREFDELYDVSDEDPIDKHDFKKSRVTYSMVTHPAEPQKFYGSKRPRYPSIIIPSPSHWPTIQKLQKMSPAQPSKIPLSPAVLSLFNRDLPNKNQAPSLDDSLTDPLACSTAPATPDMQRPEKGEVWGQAEVTQRPNSNLFNGTKEPDVEVAVRDDDWDHTEGFRFDDGPIIRDFGSDAPITLEDSLVLGMDDNVSDAGVQLSEEALRTLQHLSLDIPPVPDFVTDSASNSSKSGEMEEVPFDHSMRRHTTDMTPISQNSDYSLDQLSIPSPGGFFSSLGPGARNTWCFGKTGPPSTVMPSTTTAEYFYNCPWDMEPQAIVEHILEVDDNSTEGPPTARQIHYMAQAGERTVPESPPAPTAESIADDNEDYEKGIKQATEDSLDRTTIWLAAQSTYLSALRESNPINDVGLDPLEESKRASRHLRNNSLDSPLKKAVRFLESETAERDKVKLKLKENDTSHPGSDSIYYHAFQHISNKVRSQDAFRHRQERSDAIQANRNCLPHEHLERLQGNYSITSTLRPAPPRPISMFPGKETESDENQTTEQRAISGVERERQALEQLSTSTWVIEASRFLSGGKLLNSPAFKSLSTSNHAFPDPPGSPTMRILDLGGLPNCDWAWHCSREYAEAKVYTATTSSLDRSIRGPSNHRLASVSNLWQLPYPDNYFNSISARSLPLHLHLCTPSGASWDEYDLCLRECLRILKPGGYLDFFLLDSELVNSGPRGTAVSVEFSFNLKTRGYDPMPTKNWLGRVRRAGFDSIKRAWTFLPIGSPHQATVNPPDTPPPQKEGEDKEEDVEAVRGPVGSTADAANVAGLVGGWAWEQWMLKLQMEMGKEHLLEGVGPVLEEGKFTGGGWRCLSGWARKPVGQDQL